MRKALILIPAFLLSGCAAQVVVSDYDFRPLRADMNALATDLNSGTLQLNNFGDVVCRFQTNLTVAAPMAQHIDLDIYGNVGDTTSNANLLAFNGEALACTPSLNGIPGSLIETINLATDQHLNLGQPVTIISGTIKMTDGAEFVSDGLYGRLTITAVNQTEGTAAGTFELIAVNRADPNDARYLIMRGGFFNADM